MVLSWKRKGVEYSLEASGSTSSGFERASASRAAMSFCERGRRRKEEPISEEKLEADEAYCNAETNLDLGELRRVPPLLSPVSSSHSLRRTSTDSLEHELGRVGVVRARSSVPLEVGGQNVRVLSNVTEVNGLREGKTRVSSEARASRRFEIDVLTSPPFWSKRSLSKFSNKRALG